MNLVTIAIKSIKQRLLSSSLTALSVALGVMLMVAVLVINGVVSDLFSQPSFGFNLIVGPKGSDLSLALSAIYRLDVPGQPVPYLFYKELKEHPAVEKAVPITIGADATEQGGFPIVGTVPEFFEMDYAYQRQFQVRGEFLKTPWDAVIGSRVAATNGWGIGTEFKMIHGGTDDHVHDEKFRVVGVLAPTGTPNDRTAFVSIAGFWGIADHEKPLDEAISRLEKFRYPVPDALRAKAEKQKQRKPGAHVHDHSPPLDEQKDVSAIFVQTKTTAASILLATEINKDVRAMAVNPIFPMKRLMNMIVDNIRLMLLTLTSLIIAVSAVSIFVSIYNSMADRRREIGIMRALGARRETVFTIILAESALLCLGGGVIGLLLGHGLVAIASPVIEARSGISVNPLAFEPMELVLFPVLLVVGSLIGFLPGLAAYRTDVAAALSE